MADTAEHPQASAIAATSDDEPLRTPASLDDIWRRRNRYYYRQLHRYFKWHIPPGASVLEIGCGAGELLADLGPTRGVGVESDSKLADCARRAHPELEIIRCHYDQLRLDETFDYVVLANTLGETRDVQATLAGVRSVCRPDTRIVIAYLNALWEPLLGVASLLHLRRRVRAQNWLSTGDIRNLLRLADLEPVSLSSELLLPKYVPLLSTFLNRCVTRLWPFNNLALVSIMVARPTRWPNRSPNPSCSVVVPTHNERGNIADVIRRTPKMGSRTELIFVDGDSDDGTAHEIQRLIASSTDMDIKLVHQGCRGGKGDAVRKGFAAATGDVLMILDADLTVPPEDLPKFYDALVSGKGEFINGTRLVYPLEDRAMPFLNKCANKSFSLVFSYLLNQRFRDTLCGTKVLRRVDYQRIAAGRSYFGRSDPFGDFDLIFGAARNNLRILEIPVRYAARTYGSTSIRRFRDGWLLLRMSWVALWKLKMR